MAKRQLYLTSMKLAARRLKFLRREFRNFLFTHEELVMKKKSVFIICTIGVLVFIISLFIFNMPLLAKKPAPFSSDGDSKLVLFGIIDPEGHEHRWALPAELAARISRQLAAKYPSKKIYGVSFFNVTSWQDTGKLAFEINAQQGLLISDLIRRIHHLETKGAYRNPARRKSSNASVRPMSDRLHQLEKKVEAIDAGGLP